MTMKEFNLEEHQKGFTPVGIREDVKETDPLYHGTKANLKIGDLLEVGYASNFGEREKANYLYLSATMDAAIWGAELAVGEGKGRIYLVEPTGSIADDPNLTDMRFPGNPTRSYRTKAPLRIIGEVSDWEGHPPEVIQNMRDNIEELRKQGYGAIN
jgi:rifampin ADP-ribosylating transferase